MYGDYDAEEACQYLKIGLLCTQDNPKLRPVMSTVVKMLSGEIKIDNDKITKPGLISDFMDLKIRSNPNKTTCATNDPKKNTFNTNTSSGSDNNGELSLLSSNMTSQSTMTFTDVWDRPNWREFVLKIYFLLFFFFSFFRICFENLDPLEGWGEGLEVYII